MEQRSELSIMVILMVFLAYFVWAVTWLYCGFKVEAVEKVIHGLIQENTALTVAMAAGIATEEQKRVCRLTLAAIGAKPALPPHPAHEVKPNE